MEEILKKNLILLTQWFDPEPTPRGLSFARQLVEHGWSVKVVTGFPNYPGGKIYDGYKLRFIQKEFLDGVEIIRLPLFPSHDKSIFFRALNYLSFSFSAFFYLIFSSKNTNCIYIYHPPLTVGIVAVLIKWFRSIPLIFDIQDMWPDTLKATGIIRNPVVLSCIMHVCNFIYRNVDKIVVLSPGFKELLISRSVRHEKIEVIYNWADENALNSYSLSGQLHGLDGFKVLFAGNMGKAQSLDALIDVAKIIKTEAPGIKIIFLGSGIELNRIQNLKVKYNLFNVIFLPQVEIKYVGSYLQSADLLLVHLKDEPLFEKTIPSKTQAYMAVGKPILMAVKGDAAKLITLSGGGMTAQPENSRDIADKLIKASLMDNVVLSKMGFKAKKYYETELCIEVGVNKFINLFNLTINQSIKGIR
jgi:glycosyltransferase involved in cell wall biosynthesis